MRNEKENVKMYKANSDIVVFQKDMTIRIVRVMIDENAERFCIVNLAEGRVSKRRYTSIADAFKDLESNEDVESLAYMSDIKDDLKNASSDSVNVLEAKNSDDSD